jgi:hypothetical protein
MMTELLVREIFRLSKGITVLACEGTAQPSEMVGKQVSLTSEGVVRQKLLLLGERRMLKRQGDQNTMAIETKDVVDLISEEAKSGLWKLVWDYE